MTVCRNNFVQHTLYEVIRYDTFYNVVWATRLYDTPLWDTPVTKWGATKKDGWFGEDVGADGIFNDILGEFCWWTNDLYLSEDEGENDMKLTDFTDEVTDRNNFVQHTLYEVIRYCH